MSPTTRRNGASASAKGSPSATSIPQDEPAEAVDPVAPIPPSPYYLLIYPVILLLGSTFSVISPTASAARHYDHAKAMAPGLASDLSTPSSPPPPINYFASKRNFLNVYFVKILWFWTTLAFALILATTYLPFFLQQYPTSTRQPNTPSIRLLIQSILRYTLITIAWYLTTQWFFGPALIDRSFTLTGGACQLPLTAQYELSTPEKLFTEASGTACKRKGGSWSGGHDISGHVFLLVLSISFLLLELWLSDRLVAQAHSTASQHPHISPSAAERIARDTSEQEKREIGGWEISHLEATARKWTRRFVWTVVSLGFWMLLMTSVWFHSLGEKLSGLGLASAVIYAVFWAPRLESRWRGIIGGV